MADLLAQEPSFPLQLLALTLLEDSQDPLPPLLRQREVPHRQLHYKQVLLVVQLGAVAPVGLPGLPVHLVTGLPVERILGQHLPQLSGLHSHHHLHHRQGDSQEGSRRLLRGDRLFLRRQRDTETEPKAFVHRVEGAGVWLG